MRVLKEKMKMIPNNLLGKIWDLDENLWHKYGKKIWNENNHGNNQNGGLNIDGLKCVFI